MIFRDSLQRTLQLLVDSLKSIVLVQKEAERCLEEQHGIEEDIALGEGDQVQMNNKLENLQQKLKIVQETVTAYGVSA